MNRIDVVCPSADMAVTEASCATWHDFTMPHNNKDHIPTTAVCHPNPTCRQKDFRRRVVTYDRQGVKDPVKLAHSEQIVQGMPHCHFQVEPSSHETIVDHLVEEAAVTVFGPSFRKRQKRHWMSAAILSGPVKARRWCSSVHILRAK